MSYVAAATGYYQLLKIRDMNTARIAMAERCDEAFATADLVKAPTIAEVGPIDHAQSRGASSAPARHGRSANPHFENAGTDLASLTVTVADFLKRHGPDAVAPHREPDRAAG